MNLYVLGGFLLGLLLGYLAFYYRFADRTIVTELRKSLKTAQRALEEERQSAEEYMQQNIILRSKVQDLMSSNDDFSKMVSDLSRYYYQIRKGSEIAHDLAGFLRVPDPAMEEKIKKYLEKEPHRQLQSLHGGEEKAQFF